MQRIYYLLFLICLSVFIVGCSGGDDRIDADDMGGGSKLKLRVNSAIPEDVVTTNGKSTLKWYDTGLFVSGQGQASDGSTIDATIGLSFSGHWYPWGKEDNATGNKCVTIPCGQSQDERCSTLEESTVVVDRSSRNANCYLENGQGIYILVVQQKPDRSYDDPNSSVEMATGLSSSNFFSAHLGDFKQNNKGLTKVDQLFSCKRINGRNSKYSFQPKPVNDLAGGKIYLRVSDQYYSDNTTNKLDEKNRHYISVSIKNGVYYPNFISSAIEALRGTIKIVTEGLSRSILKTFQDIAFVVILLYFILTALGFLTGLVKLTQTEVAVRLLKIGIVLMLTSPQNEMADSFKNLYGSLAAFGANVIASSLPNMPSTKAMASDTLSDQMGYLIVYDMLLNQIISFQVQTKIISLIFSRYIWCVPLLYMLLIIMVMVIFRAILIYIIAYVQISILIIILPILAVMLLFKVTGDWFQDWLKYMANSALLIIIATMGMGLVLGLMNKQLGELMHYSVQQGDLGFLWLKWWIPNWTELEKAITLSACLNALITSLICQAFIEKLPDMAKALSDARISPSSAALSSLWHGVPQTFKSWGSNLRDFNAKYLMGSLLNLGHSDDSAVTKALDSWKRKRDAVNDAVSYLKKPIDYVKKSVDGAEKLLRDGRLFIGDNDNNNDELQKQINALQKENSEIAKKLNAGKEVKSYHQIGFYEEQIQKKQDDIQTERDKLEANRDKVRLKDTTGNTVDVVVDDGTGNVDFTDSGGRQQISKDDIRRAVSGGGNISIGGVNYTAESLYDKSYGDALAKKAEELGRISQELDKIKRK